MLATKQTISEFPRATANLKARARVGRNEPCVCGSGRKYKKCCGR
ncbi:SEC-C metal-binding domain-containing protein [Sphingomonas sp. Tas61C01]